MSCSVFLLSAALLSYTEEAENEKKKQMKSNKEKKNRQVITSLEVKTAVCASQKQMLLLGQIDFVCVCVRAHALVTQHINPISFGSPQQFLQVFMWRGNVWVSDDIIRRSGWREEKERE